MITTLTPVQLNKFVGRRNPFSIQSKVGYTPVHRKITMADFIDHINGKFSYGTYVIREDGKVNYAAIDIDGETGEDMEVYERLGYTILDLFPDFERVLEFSGRRGYHVWIFPEQPEPPIFMRELVKSRLNKIGLYRIEVFPKQDSADLGKGLGNLIKLPCGLHKKGGWSKIIEWVNNCSSL